MPKVIGRPISSAATKSLGWAHGRFSVGQKTIVGQTDPAQRRWALTRGRDDWDATAKQCRTCAIATEAR